MIEIAKVLTSTSWRVPKDPHPRNTGIRGCICGRESDSGDGRDRRAVLQQDRKVIKKLVAQSTTAVMEGRGSHEQHPRGGCSQAREIIGHQVGKYIQVSS